MTAAPPAAERTLRKRENTRARLIEAAADIVASKGIASTRIDDIVKQAGFTGVPSTPTTPRSRTS